MKFQAVILAALFSLALFLTCSASAQNGPVEKRYAGSFRDHACTVTLQWVTTVDSVSVSGSLTTQSGAVLQVSGAETSPGMLELTVETDESINHKLSLADAGGKAIWAGTYLTFIETGSPAAAPTGVAMPPAGVAPAPGGAALPPLGGGLPPLPAMPGLPATGTPAAAPAGTGTPPSPPTGATAMPPLGGSLPPLPGSGGLTMQTAPGGLTPGVATGPVPTGRGPLVQPAMGSAERKAILDAIRPRAQGDLGGAVEFVVTEMRVQDGFCFTRLEPQRPGGKKIAMSETVYAREEFMDGLTIFALLGKTGNGWSVLAYVVGPTDVVYEPWPEQYGAPRSVFGW